MDAPALSRLLLAALLGLGVVTCGAAVRSQQRDADLPKPLALVDNGDGTESMKSTGADRPDASRNRMSPGSKQSIGTRLASGYAAVGSRLKNDTEDVSKLTNQEMANRLVFGSRVVRGKDWKWGDQDGGAGSEGIVISNGVLADGWVIVRWDSIMSTNEYRMGKGFFDLRLVAAEPKVPSVKCGQKLYFQCGGGECTRKSDLCDDFKDCRDGSDEKNCDEPQKMSGEKTAQLMAFGSRVVRADKDGDGGPGSEIEGTVVSNGVFADNKALVRWDDGRYDVEYRMGNRGFYDLRLVALKPDVDDDLISRPCTYFKCGSGDCTRKKDVCDGTQDCQDGSDETKCDTPFLLNADQTRNVMKFGSRVVRGPHWSSGFQDGDPPGEGVVVSNGVLADSRVLVHWANNTNLEPAYRMTRERQPLRLITLKPRKFKPKCKFFTCDGSCLSYADVCDKYRDCRDGKDEVNCDSPGNWTAQQTAALLKFGSPVVRGPDWEWDKQDGDPPTEGVVISKGVLADGWVLVKWKSGEQNNYRMKRGQYDLKAVAGPRQDLEGLKCDEFTCGSGECVRESDVCDNHNDCSDAADEEKCQKTCGTGDFRCKNGYAVKWDKKCDGTPDCADGSDEHPDLCDGPSTTLTVGETVTATMEFAKSYEALRFSLCFDKNCETLMMHGLDGDGKLAAELLPFCNRWGVHCQKGFWLTDRAHRMLKRDVERTIPDCEELGWPCELGDDTRDEPPSIRSFFAGELSFQIQRNPVSVMIWLGGKPASSVSVSMSSLAGSTRLRISALNCEGSDLMPVTYTAHGGCGDGNFKCGDGASIGYQKKCDGTVDCADGSDEDLKLCDESTTTLAEGETVTATVNFKKAFESLRFSLCNAVNCESIMVRGLNTYGDFISDGYTNCNKWGVHCEDGFPLTTSKLERLVDLIPGELEFVVQRQPEQMVIWLKVNPNQNLTMEVPKGRYRLRISALHCEGNLMMPVKYSVVLSSLGSQLPFGSAPSQLLSPTTCGVGSHKVSLRIIGGSDTSAGEFPWHAGLYVDGQYNCGGSLLADRIVITAAHCVFSPETYRLYTPQQLRVTVGTTFIDWTKDSSDQVQRRNVKRIFPHLDYRGEAKRYEADIAILELAAPVTVGPAVVPICVDLQGYVVPQLVEHDMGKVPGWGLTKNQGPSPVLQTAELPYIPRQKCLSEVPDDYLQYLSTDKFCAGYINGTSLARGDSGGGLVFQHDGRWYLQGIVSVGHRSVLTYNAFTKVSLYVPWIEATLRTIFPNAPRGRSSG